MEGFNNKRKSYYTEMEKEKRSALIDEILDELSEENLTSYTTQFLSDLAEFIENYGYDD